MKKSITFISLILCLVLVGCKSKENQETKVNEYNSNDLTIAVIGNTPEVTNAVVTYEYVDLESIKMEDLNDYDAVFVMANMFDNASKEQYAEMYKTPHKPFFFIGTKKSYIPFTDSTLSYKDALATNDDSYVTGIAYNGDEKFMVWKFSYSEQDTENNLKELYNNIYTVINDYLSNH